MHGHFGPLVLHVSKSFEKRSITHAIGTFVIQVIPCVYTGTEEHFARLSVQVWDLKWSNYILLNLRQKKQTRASQTRLQIRGDK